MDEIFHEEERDSRFSKDTAFLKPSRQPDQVTSLCMLFRVRWCSADMLTATICP